MASARPVAQRSIFLLPYLQWFEQATDAPMEFGTIGGLMCLSGIALGRRWYCGTDRGTNSAELLHPNLFAMVVGESSVARKSTSVKFARKVLTEVNPERIGPSDFTLQGLAKWMKANKGANGKGRTRLVCFSDEYGKDLVQMDSFNKDLKAGMCQIYDGGMIESARATSAGIKIANPRLSFFAASAYDMLSTYLAPSDWFIGYLMRFIYISPQWAREEKWIMPSPRPGAFEAAVRGLQTLQDAMYGNPLGISITKPAIELYVASKQAHNRRQPKNSAIMTPYLARFWVNVEKLALLFQLDEDPMADIGEAAMHQAIDFALKVCWPAFMTTVERTAAGDFRSLATIVTTILVEAGAEGVMRSTLGGKFIGNPMLSKVLNEMAANRVITMTPVSIDGEMDTIIVHRRARARVKTSIFSESPPTPVLFQH